MDSLKGLCAKQSQSTEEKRSETQRGEKHGDQTSRRKRMIMKSVGDSSGSQKQLTSELTKTQFDGKTKDNVMDEVLTVLIRSITTLEKGDGKSLKERKKNTRTLKY